MKSKKDIVKMLLKQNLEEKDEQELIDLLIDSPIAVDIDKEEEEKMTFKDRVADYISAKAGSWGFIIVFCSLLITWIILNGFSILKNVDPYPFILLNLVLSCVAALQAPIIMMSQNRQARKDSLRNHNDFRIDLKSELILEILHDQIETLIKNQNKIIKYIDSEKVNKD